MDFYPILGQIALMLYVVLIALRSYILVHFSTHLLSPSSLLICVQIRLNRRFFSLLLPTHIPALQHLRYHIRDLRRIRNISDHNIAATIATSPVRFRLDCCNRSLFFSALHHNFNDNSSVQDALPEPTLERLFALSYYTRSDAHFIG